MRWAQFTAACPRRPYQTVVCIPLEPCQPRTAGPGAAAGFPARATIDSPSQKPQTRLAAGVLLHCRGTTRTSEQKIFSRGKVGSIKPHTPRVHDNRVHASGNSFWGRRSASDERQTSGGVADDLDHPGPV